MVTGFGSHETDSREIVEDENFGPDTGETATGGVEGWDGPRANVDGGSERDAGRSDVISRCRSVKDSPNKVGSAGARPESAWASRGVTEIRGIDESETRGPGTVVAS